MDLQIGNPQYFSLLGVAAVLCVLAGYAAWSRRLAIRRFVTSNLTKRIVPVRNPWRFFVSTFLLTFTLVLIGLAVVDIRWGKTTREVPQKGIEVMFALDVSRSMLAEDATPNRLIRAKQQIEDMVAEMTGDRVGLVIFAGDSKQSVPLTSHYDDFRQILDSVGTHSLNRGGSRLGDAIRAAADGFISKTNDHKAIVIFTDGEDQESDPLEAARSAYTDQGIRIFTVGLGDIEQGALVPVDRDDRQGRGGTTYLRYKGETVRSKMNGAILSEIATTTDGAYIPAGTQRVDMASVYHRYVASVQQTEFETATVDVYTPRFQWFAAPALVLLLIEVFISTWRKRESRRTAAIRVTPVKSEMTSRAATMLAVLALTLPAGDSVATEPDVARAINAANDLLRAGKVEDALTQYSSIDDAGMLNDELAFDLGVAKFRAGDVDAASQLFASAAGSDRASLASRSRYNLGNCCYAQALQLVESDKPAAVEKLREAIGHYRGSLATNANNLDARANIELAAKLIQQLQEQSSDNQDQGDQAKPQSDDQESSAEKSSSYSENENQQPSDSDSSSEQPSDQEKQSSGDDEPTDESESRDGDAQPNSKESPPDDSGMEESQSESESSPTPEQNASPSPDTSENPGDTSAMNRDEQSQQKSLAQDESLAEEASQTQEDGTTPQATDGELKPTDPNAESQPGVAAGTAQSDEGSMTLEEALKMLQAVRDRDLLRRMQQERRQQSQRYNVERDW